MTKKRKERSFKNVNEFREFYACEQKKKRSEGSRYYRIGEDVARMACEKAVNKLAHK